MTRRSLAWLAFTTLALAVGGQSFASAVALDEKSVAGLWTWKWTRPGGDGTVMEIKLKLKQDGETLTGKITSGPNNTETEIKEGKFKDGEVTFKVERERNGQVFSTLYKGKAEGDTIKGKTERTMNGNTTSRDWEAKRTAEGA